MNIKRYELNNEITPVILEKNNFDLDGMIREVGEPRYSYDKILIDTIRFHLEIGTDFNGNLEFNDSNHILILDDKTHQPYYPFYFENGDEKCLNEVIIGYNKVMDELVEKGILKEKIMHNEKKKILK